MQTITVDASWQTPAFTNKYATFYNCTSLVDGNGTTYSSGRISDDYMRIDSVGQAGYLRVS
ncbi:hypothetical protein [Adlercreutzia sp. ZJ305]|uniref:hypothetical protein n=1 Tax=Adlercreutzia sp. ZJ305 TaxID=2709408 RepID=UPI0013ECD58C|nr:hypothetical protein [Adlercreutzia sp. ZJ305]